MKKRIKGRKKGTITGQKGARGGRQYERQALVLTDTQSCLGGTMLVTWVQKKGAHHDDHGLTQASVWSADRLSTPPPGTR